MSDICLAVEAYVFSLMPKKIFENNSISFRIFLLDENNGYISRLLGFSVYISNTTSKEDGVLCFRDISYTRATILNPVNITCVQHGRYVIYYNNRTNSPYPTGYSTYAYNELCEVEVYGKTPCKTQIFTVSFKKCFFKYCCNTNIDNLMYVFCLKLFFLIYI